MMPVDPRHWSDRAVVVYDHGKGRHVNRFETCLRNPGGDVTVTLGWDDTKIAAERRRAIAAQTLVAWAGVAHEWERIVAGSTS